jgi:hypothetical protein
MKGEKMLVRVMPGVLVILLAAIFVLSDRPWLPTSMPAVSEVETLPDTPKMADVRDYTEMGSAFLPHTEKEKARRQAEQRRQPYDYEKEPLRLGWSYREVSFLRMPFFAYEEFGLVTYFDRPGGYHIALLPPAQVELLGELTGKDYRGSRFPFYLYLWGWLFPIAAIALVWLYLRQEAKRREEQGII